MKNRKHIVFAKQKNMIKSTHDEQVEKVNNDVALFLANGGKIDHVDNGATGVKLSLTEAQKKKFGNIK